MPGLQQYPWWVYPLLVIDLILKGMGLWFSAREGKRWWFIAILIINSAGIVPSVYLIFFSKHFRQYLVKKKLIKKV